MTKYTLAGRPIQKQYKENADGRCPTVVVRLHTAAAVRQLHT